MVSHGFGGAKLRSSIISEAEKEKIAKCISKVPGVVWAHVVHAGFKYDSQFEEKAKMIRNREVELRYDFILEMHRKLSEEELKEIHKCADKYDHDITIELMTVKDDSWHKEKPMKHPKKID